MSITADENMRLVAEILYPKYLQSHKVTTDSREVSDGCLFFAFKGSHFDGNAFAPQALEQGAALCIVDHSATCQDPRCIVVDDVLETLQLLALYHRMHTDIPVVGITGTNGKTTTKELVCAVLKRRYRTHATTGNHNNHLGVPLTLLSMPPDTEMAVVEMGANHPGEIEALCQIVRPNYGLITNVGRAHLEGFGSFDGVVRTKTELYRALAAVGGTIFVNADNALLVDKAIEAAQVPVIQSLLPGIIPTMDVDLTSLGSNRSASVVTYGRTAQATTTGAPIAANPYMKFYFEKGDNVYTVQSNLLGAYNFDNAMAAVCIGQHFGVDLFDIKEAIEQYHPTNNRSQLLDTRHNHLILDCYNANPSSMQAAIANLAELQVQPKMAMLGEMKELGAASDKEHRAVMHQIEASDVQRIVLVGDAFRFATTASDSRIAWYRTVDEACQALRQECIKGATILIKGSNSMRMWLLRDVL